jgi:hypothetical protein
LAAAKKVRSLAGKTVAITSDEGSALANLVFEMKWSGFPRHMSLGRRGCCRTPSPSLPC